jgi:effector-binding domain-containing protein
MTKGAIANSIGAFTKKWHFQAGIPTGIQLETSGLMNCRKIGKKSYIKTVHHGPYHKVGQTYKKMYAWAKERDEVLGDESIECYLNDPRETKKSMLETMVLIPVS